MKRAILYGMLGIGLAILPCYGAITSQTDWLKEPVVMAAEYKEEEIKAAEGATNYMTEDPEEDAPRQQAHTRREEVTQKWWEIKYVNDPDIPDELEEACYIYSDMFNVSAEFMEAISARETAETYAEDIKGDHDRSFGAFQINIKAQCERIADYGLTPEDMLTYDGGAIVAFSYVAELFERYEDPAVVLMKYNGASTALKKYRQTGELNAYTRWVLDKAMELEEKHGLLDEERTKG